MATSSDHNPYAAPGVPIVAGALPTLPTLRSDYLTPLAKWSIVLVVAEVALAKLTLSHEYWHAILDERLTVVPCLFMNLVMLGIVSWKVGRRFSVVPAVFVSQLVHTLCWLTYVLSICIFTKWGLGDGDWQSPAKIVAGSAIVSGIAATAASHWFRIKPATMPNGSQG